MERHEDEGGDYPAAAMLITVTDPAFVDDLVRYLWRTGFTVNDRGENAVGIDRGGEERAVVREQLQVYLRLWESTRSGVSVAVERDEAETSVS
jgi:hypothetical protein